MSDVQCLIEILDRAYDKRSWHGTNLRGSVRGLTVDDAAWRPAPGRHNSWEIVVHAAYWKYTIWRRLADKPKGSFPLKGSNWFRRDDPRNADLWKRDVRLMDQTHRDLRTAIANLSRQDLRRTAPNRTLSYFDLLAGIGAHDLYHAGQIQLLKRLR